MNEQRPVPRTSLGRRLLYVLLGLFVWVTIGFARSYLAMGVQREERLLPSAASSHAEDGPRLEMARRFAPVIFHAFHPTYGRQDVPAPFDFDGNMRGDDNWESFVAYELIPTVYYSVVETKTHAFLTYHIFHPRDWSKVDLGLHLTHENDGENLQVVVDKRSGLPTLLYAQAHYRGVIYADQDAGASPADEPIYGPLTRVNAEGRLDPEGEHAAVYVEWGGHGIYGLPDHRSPVRFDGEGAPRFEGHGWILRPAEDGEAVREPSLEETAPVPYLLEPLKEATWSALRSRELLGSGGLLDGAVTWEGIGSSIEVPRYYEGDRFSGPFGPDRGISPFAVDFDFQEGFLGSLLFDPAARWAQAIELPSDWSRAYLHHDYLPQAIAEAEQAGD